MKSVISLTKSLLRKPSLVFFQPNKMSNNYPDKNSSYYIDWWTIRRSTVYLLGLLLFVIVGGSGFSLYVWKYGYPFQKITSNAGAMSGVKFTTLEGEVRVVRANTREIINADNYTVLLAGDTVQTQSDGRARIQMADGSVLLVRPNSTVVIRDNTGNLQGANVRLSLDGGQINVRTEDNSNASKNVVEIRQSESNISSQTDASFSVNTNTENEEIRVTRGKLETTTKSGERTVARGGDYIAVSSNGSIARKEKLLDAPELSSPASQLRVFVEPNINSSFTLRWQRPNNMNATNYSVAVSTSPFFVETGKVFEREQIEANEISITDLRVGTYFWRVRATASSGQVSEWSEPWKFSIAVRDVGKLRVSEWQVEHIGGRIYIVNGKTNPGATIQIADRETFANSDGTFKLQISSPSTETEAIIKDDNGNVSRYALALNKSKAALK